MPRGLLTDIRDAANAVREAACELREIDVAPRSSALGLNELGAVAVLLALRWPAWVDRRELEISFVDDATVRIKTAVSFHLTPAALGADLPPGTRLFVPIDMPEKRTLLNLQIVDEAGDALAPVNQVRNGDLAGRGLVRLFSQLLSDAGLELPPRTAHALRELAQVPAAEALRHQAEAIDSAGVLGRWLAEGPNKVRPEIQIIKGLTQGFLQLVQIEYEPGRERRIETAHDLPLPWPNEQSHKWLVRLGALSQQRTFEPVPIGRARSTHVEFVAPEDIDLVSAKLQGTQYDTVNDVHHELRAHARSFERSRERAGLHVMLLAGSEIHDSTVITREHGRELTPHEKQLQLQIEGASDQAAATVSLLPRRSGTIPAAGLASAATAIVLGVFASRLQELDGQTGAAVLLLLPAVLAAYLSRPGEHRFTTHALRAVRVLAIVSAVCAVVLSAMIAGGFLSTGITRAAPVLGATTSAPVVASAAHVPVQAKVVAVGLTIVSGLIALILVLAWGLATLMARLVPSDDELARVSRIARHPRPGS